MEVTHVETALDGDLAERVGLVPGGDLQDPGRTGCPGQPGLAGQFVHSVPSGLHVEWHLPTEQMWRDAPEQDMRIGDGWLLPTLAVAQWPRVCPRRLWAHFEGALTAEPGDRAPTCAHRHHVDHGDLRRVRPDRALRRQGWMSLDDHRHVRGGAAAVTGDDPGKPGSMSDHGSAECTRGGA